MIADLRRCGVLRESDSILFRHAMVILNSNVIFDLDRARALAVVHGYLRDLGIECCGRYGEWDCLRTDESFISGENAAERGIAHVGAPVRLSMT